MLVFLEPDIGTALVYAAALAAVLFVAGARWSHLAALGSPALVGSMAVLWWLPAVGVHVLKPYQAHAADRLHAPELRTRSGSTYNLDAVDDRGRRRRAARARRRRRDADELNYLPEHETDFAFASLAEQRGFLGASLLLLLYLLVVWRG